MYGEYAFQLHYPYAWVRHDFFVLRRTPMRGHNNSLNTEIILETGDLLEVQALLYVAGAVLCCNPVRQKF